ARHEQNHHARIAHRRCGLSGTGQSPRNRRPGPVADRFAGACSMRLPSYRIALAVGEPHEARLLALLEAATCQVAGHGCAVTKFCSTIRELRDALGHTDSIDAVVMSSSLQAVPTATLDELVAIGRALVLVVPDPAASRWSDRPVPVLGLD